jgi:hypothetical protein
VKREILNRLKRELRKIRGNDNDLPYKAVIVDGLTLRESGSGEKQVFRSSQELRKKLSDYEKRFKLLVLISVDNERQ